MIDSLRSKAATGDVLAARGLAEYYAEAGSATESLRWLELAYVHSPTAEDPQSITSGLYDKVRNDPQFGTGLARIHAQINSRTQRARGASP